LPHWQHGRHQCDIYRSHSYLLRRSTSGLILDTLASVL
jgi:hypothetical protein